MRLELALLAVAGCYNPAPAPGAPCINDQRCPSGQLCIEGFCGGPATPTPDGTVTDTAVSCSSWTPKYFDPCTIPMTSEDLHLTVALSGYSFDTDSGTLKGKMNTVVPTTTMVISQASGPDAMLLAVHDFTLDVGATLTITGSRPFVLAATGAATIAGTIDGSATLGTPGPGGDDTTECTTATGDNGTNVQPSQGGGGGAMQGGGGKGGNLGAMGGASIGAPTHLRGGCPGGTGGSGTTTTAPRGAGGGALQIASRTTITVTGVINAGGGGGAGGRANYGGGGAGGSGGFIGLDSPIVTITGTLASNGGAGGGGASDFANGNNGGDAKTTTTPASAGAGATSSNVGTCANGGVGAAGTTLVGGNGGTSVCGGGGGGGGAGFILVWSTVPTLGGTITPGALAGN